MGNPEKKKPLTVVRIPAEVAVVALAPLMRLSTDSPNVSLQDMCNGSECYRVINEEGEPVLHYVLRRVLRSNGKKDGFIMAAEGKCSGVNLINAVLPHIEQQLADCDTVEVRTKRRGLGARLATHGYHLGGVILRKSLT
jgi:hypothetical protein